MSKTIFVSGGSGIVGYGILKSLRQTNLALKLVTSTIHKDSVAPGFSDFFELAPYTSDPSYFSWLADIIVKYNIDMVVPSIESDVFAWNANRSFFSQFGVTLLLNDERLISLCQDKWLFYLELEKHKSPYAIDTSLQFDSNWHKFPLLLKPRRGSASQGVVIINNFRELEEHMQPSDSHLLIQPVIGSGDEEYTTSAFFDIDSQLCAYMTLRRRLSKQGFTEIAHTVDLPGIKEALQELAKIFCPVGPTNFQFRLAGKQLKLLEINPRISSATSIRTAFGYNESQMSFDYFLNGRRPTQPTLKKGHSVRYTEDMIFYDSFDL